ncbi:hypothetical protein BN137_1518 [Cronobacter condimenti 1330]|uniref:Uncharacterized protein n=1 Tax=Cronobacter condimenti 1330 TaxID=1073999 RepID=K7ZZE7_9ENTR|nr:hypothetical protein [Cronobacter condimenti]CCJ72163.1 hypothetical protein BN137_1518 [Cronobacter condimenti 1330]
MNGAHSTEVAWRCKDLNATENPIAEKTIKTSLPASSAPFWCADTSNGA